MTDFEKVVKPYWRVKIAKWKQGDFTPTDVDIISPRRIAVAGYVKNEKKSVLYVSISSFDTTQKESVEYYKEFDEQTCNSDRLISFIDDFTLVTICGCVVMTIDIKNDCVKNIFLLNLGNACYMFAKENKIFIAFIENSALVVLNYDLKDIHRISLDISKDELIIDMVTVPGILCVCTSGEHQRAMSIYEEDGKILTAYTIPTDEHISPSSIAARFETNLVAVYGGDEGIISFHSLFEGNLLFHVKVGTCNNLEFECRLRIAHDKEVYKIDLENYEVNIFKMEDFVTLEGFILTLYRLLDEDDCEKMSSYFRLLGNSNKEADDKVLYFLYALQRQGIINARNVHELRTACEAANVSENIYDVIDFYQKYAENSQIGSFQKFVASLSTHISSTLCIKMCKYFGFSPKETQSVITKTNPGPSLLLCLQRKGIIRATDVSCLKKPLTELMLVQALTKVEEYEMMICKEVDEPPEYSIGLSTKDKASLLMNRLKAKIKHMFDAITPVPWKKSCRWHIKDLFICTGLILTKSGSTLTDKNVDSKCKLKSSAIFGHKNLKDESRIVVEGEPGSGKTMLSYSIANDWVEGRLSDIDILVLLPLKFVKNRTISQSVKEFYVPDEDSMLSEKDVELILCSSELRCCVVLDGVEEYTGGSFITDGKSSELTQVMQMEKLQSCKVIATARSDYCQDFPDYPVLKITGFGDAERKDYVERMFQGNKEKQQDAISKINNNPLLLDLCSVPLMFVLVVHNIEIFQQNEWKNLTVLMQNIIQAIGLLGSTGAHLALQARLSKVDLTTNENFNLETLDSESSDSESSRSDCDMNEECFLQHTAFEGLRGGNQQLFWQKDFIEMYSVSMKQAIECGILITEDGMESLRSNVIESNPEVDGHSNVFTRKDPKSLQETNPLSSYDVDKGLKTEPTSKKESNDAEKVEINEVAKSKRNKLYSKMFAREIQKDIENVPLQLRFLHKVIQEYFAAKYLISDEALTEEDDQFQLLLSSIDPVDLHHVFRFACGQNCNIAPSIMKHLLDRYRRVKDVPRAQATLNCLFLCFEEYNDDLSSVSELVRDICQEIISVDQGDSRLLKKSKVTILEFASKFEIPIQKLQLNDVVTQVNDMEIILEAGVTLQPLKTLQGIVVSQWDHRLTEKDYLNMLKFVSRSRSICEARFHLPSTPPVLDETTMQEISTGSSRVVWKVGSLLEHTLDKTSGKWKLCTSRKANVKEEEDSHDTGLQHYCELEKEVTISGEGGTIAIHETGVELYIPPNALQEDTSNCLVHIRIIPHSLVGEPAQSFSSNSSMIVELLPNRLSLSYPAQLTLPHCLQLKKGVPWKAKVFVSHHEIGVKPCWKEVVEKDPNQVCKLDETSCSIWLKNFCWVKYEVGDEIVEGKKIIIYTARKKLSCEDSVAQVDVGYYPQLSEEGEIFRLNKDIIVAEKKPLLFLKEGKKPLQVHFEKSVPEIWQYPKTEENPMEISFRSIALSDERCIPFLLEKKEVCADDSSVPTCLFKAWQDEKEKIHLTIRLQVEKEQQTSEDSLVTTKDEMQDVRKKTYPRRSQETTYQMDTETKSHDFKVRSSSYPNTERSPSNFAVETSYSPDTVFQYPSSPFFSSNDTESQPEEARDSKELMPHEEHLGAVGGHIPSRRRSQPIEALSARFQQLQTAEDIPDNPPCDKRMMQSTTVQNQYNISQVCYGYPDYMGPLMLLTSEGSPRRSNMFSLSYTTMMTIANRLDGPDVLGNNWQRLADEMGFNLDEVLALQRCNSPTEALINTAIRMGKLNSLNQLRNILKRIKREDAAAAVPCEVDQNIPDNSN